MSDAAIAFGWLLALGGGLLLGFTAGYHLRGLEIQIGLGKYRRGSGRDAKGMGPERG